MRPQVSVFLAVTLDGCIARPDGGLDFLDGYTEDHGYEAFVASVDCLVMGRNTYDVVLGFGVWPFGERRVVVCTSRPLEPRHGEEAYGGELPTLLDRLGAEGVRHVYLDGGRMVRQGLAADVVDDLTLTVVPRVLGDGIPLFASGLRESGWRLTGAQSFASGLAQLRYVRAR